MTEQVPILTREEMREILRAAYMTLRYAVRQARKLEPAVDPSRAVVDGIEQSLLSLEAAYAPRSSTLSIRGHSANATQRLRSCIRHLSGMPVGSPDQSSALRALRRTVALLGPLTQDQGPYDLIPRKQHTRRRRVSGRRKMPRFDIAISDLTHTNFYTGLEKRIDAGGIFIATYNLYPRGSIILLTAALPNERCIVGSGTVQWVREHNEDEPNLPPGMGVSLNNLTQSASLEINRHLAQHESLFFEAG